MKCAAIIDKSINESASTNIQNLDMINSEIDSESSSYSEVFIRVATPKLKIKTQSFFRDFSECFSVFFRVSQGKIKNILSPPPP